MRPQVAHFDKSMYLYFRYSTRIPHQTLRLPQAYRQTFRAAQLPQPRGVIAHGPVTGAGPRAAHSLREAPSVIRPCEREARAVAAAIGACNEAREGPNRRQLLQMARAKDSAKAVVASRLRLEEQPTSSAQSKPRGSCPTMACGLQLHADERKRTPWPLPVGLPKAAPLLRGQQPQQQPQQQQRQRATRIVESQRQRHGRSPAENEVHAKRYCRCWHAKPYVWASGEPKLEVAPQNLKLSNVSYSNG